MAAISRFHLLWTSLLLLPCQSFVGGRLVKRPFVAAPNCPLRLTPTTRPLLDLRGGSSEASPLLQASLGDHSEAARAIFGNFVTPATLLLTALIPLSLQDIALSKIEQSTYKQKLKGLYYVIGLLSTCSELICVMYASITSSQLLEATMLAPATSAFALIQRDYELAWIATTVHFIGGLMGFMVMSGLGAFLSFPKKYNTAGAFFAVASLLWVTRLLNARAVLLQQDGIGNCFFLLKRYIILGIRQLQSSSSNVLGITSIVLTGIAVILTMRALFTSNDD